MYFWLSKNVGLCPNNWMHLQGSCYKVSSGKSNWTAAKSTCEAMGSKLAMVTSQAEQQALATLNLSHRVWIGLRRDPKNKSRWFWVDGSRATYTHWGDGEPNNGIGNEDCTYMFPPDGKWNDAPCSWTVHYVCDTNGRWQDDYVHNILWSYHSAHSAWL